jgi:hypothetical protein
MEQWYETLSENQTKSERTGSAVQMVVCLQGPKFNPSYCKKQKQNLNIHLIIFADLRNHHHHKELLIGVIKVALLSY